MSLDDIVLERLFEQRDFHLNALKHLDFQLALEPAEDSEKIKELQAQTIIQLKKIEQELAFRSNSGNSQ